MFAEDLLIIERLRNEAINVQEPHVSGVSRLVTYAAQLKWLGGKFPVDVSRLMMQRDKVNMSRLGWNFRGILRLDSILLGRVSDIYLGLGW